MSPGPPIKILPTMIKLGLLLTLVIKQFILLNRVFRDDQLAADPIQEHNCRLICARFLEGGMVHGYGGFKET
jgi:hypothetical protein